MINRVLRLFSFECKNRKARDWYVGPFKLLEGRMSDERTDHFYFWNMTTSHESRHSWDIISENCF